MSRLTVTGARKSFGAEPVLRGVDLAVPAGEVAALLGASGSGKTTLLRLIAGFEPAEAGRVSVGDRVLAAPGLHVPPERRRIGYVPQEGTLFPHLTVAGNVGFGLTRAERRDGRLDAALRLTGLTDFARRYPHQISGGQQQRAALARALAPRPALVLLDEPFNALDLELRRTVCAEVIATLRRAEATALLVTHDPHEAFASADRIAVMIAGTIAQCDTPHAVYRRPVSPAVARLTGETILLAAVPRDGFALTVLGPLPAWSPAPIAAARAAALLRPEQIRLRPPDQGIPATLLERRFRGDHTLLSVAIGDVRLGLRTADEVAAAPGERLGLIVRGECMLFGAQWLRPLDIRGGTED